MYNDLTKAQSAISAVMANINLVYKANFNVFLQVNDVLVQTTTGGVTWNNKPATKGGRCSNTINNALDTFTAWRKSAQAKRNGIWHLFTNWSESMNSSSGRQHRGDSVVAGMRAPSFVLIVCFVLLLWYFIRAAILPLEW